MLYAATLQHAWIWSNKGFQQLVVARNTINALMKYKIKMKSPPGEYR